MKFNYIGAFLCVTLVAASCTAIAGEPIEQQVTFHGEDNTPLVGTLMIPSDSSSSRHPGMVLLAGSGPTDRDGNQPPRIMTDLLKQIANSLANRGIVTLRFDKRGMYANAAALPKDRATWPKFFSWENFSGDAASAFRFLRRQPQVDAAHVGILGHSEGGLLALDAARILRNDPQKPAALILLSTPGRTIDLILSEQIDSLLTRQGATQQQSEYFKKENTRILEAIRQTGSVPKDVPAGLQAVYPSYLGPFLKSEIELDPAKVAADFSGPVLLIAGGADIQVSADRDATSLDRALTSRLHDDHRLLIVPNTSHNLKHVESPIDPGFTGPVETKVLDEITIWASTKLFLANPPSK